jgi:hypothetical protein
MQRAGRSSMMFSAIRSFYRRRLRIERLQSGHTLLMAAQFSMQM